MRLRIRFSKLGKVRFTSHRDAARIWERSLHRAEVPLAMTEGFRPRPKLSFGLALPTGAESIAEYLDVELAPNAEEGLDLAELPARLSEALPLGFEALAIAEIDQRAESLQSAVQSSTWELWGPALDAESHRAALALIEQPELILERERKGKRSADDVRPMILSLRFDEPGDRLIADLATVGRALRPAELAELAYPGVDPRDTRALRTHQWLDHDGERHEVLALPADVDVDTLGVPA